MKLQNQQIQITVAPDSGGALQEFIFKGQEILRSASPDEKVPQNQALFIMMPYCSYIKDGHFNYFGISRHVPSNDPSNELAPLHGDIWKDRCKVEKQSDHSVTLCYCHTKETGFPFDYTAKITYELKANELHVTLSIYNPSDLPMPCGMGVHPYFVHSKTAIIQFDSSHVWHHQQDPIFDRPYPTPTQWNFAKGKQIKEDFDTAFGGWDGQAIITYPDEKIQIQIQAQDIFHHIILYTPKDSDSFCLEPVSNTPDAFNLATYGVIGTGIQSIGAHQTLSKTIVFTCKTL